MIFNVLIIEDHPIIIEAYKKILHEIDLKFSIHIAVNSLECSELIDSSNNTFYDLVILDINLSNDNLNMSSGEFIGTKIRKKFPNTKICVITMLNNAFRVGNIISSLNPEGFLFKSDVDGTEIQNALLTILQKNCPFYSSSILKMMHLRRANKFVLDEIDLQILHFISSKLTTKEISNHVPLSIAGIEKRKRNLKKIFEITEGDRELIQVAKSKGFI